MTPQQALARIVAGERLARGEAAALMRAVMEGEATPAQIGALLVALRMRGEDAREIAGFAEVMRDKATRVMPPEGVVVDTCGTGGDGLGTVNVSTLAALVVAACGVPVAKHGNRSVSSRVGSADLLEGLGVVIDAGPRAVEACLRETGFGFLFAPLHHEAMRHVAGPRRELGLRTVFNLLGPLTNPARATHQLLGVYAPDLTEVLAAALRDLGTQGALVVHGEGGLDEISPSGETAVVELLDGGLYRHTWKPEDFGLRRHPIESLRGGDLETNVRLAREVLRGAPGPLADAVALNAGAALYLAGVAGDVRRGVQQALEALHAGAAAAKLEAIVACTRRHA